MPPPGSLSPRAVSLAFLVVAGVAIGLVLLRRAAPYSSPERTLARLSDAITRADLDRLLNDEVLGFSTVVQQEVSARGGAEYERVLVLLDRCRSLGEQEYRRLVARRDELLARAATAGADAFAALPTDEKYRVWVGATREEWLFEQTGDLLGEEMRARMGTVAVLADRGAHERRARELGMTVLTDSERTVVAKADATPALAEDPYVRPLVQRRDQEGRRLLDEALSAYRNAASRVSPLPPFSAEHRAHQAEREREMGRGHLSADELAFLDGFQPAEEQQLPPRVVDLGRAQLPAEDRARLGDWTVERLRAEKKSFVLAEGRRLFRAFLLEHLGGCRPNVESVAFEGWVPASLVRSWHATVRVRWPAAGAGKVVALRDGTVAVVGLDDPVPSEWLRGEHQEDVVTWRAARDSGVLAFGVNIGASTCDAFLGREFSLYNRGGDWWIAWPPMLPPQAPLLPGWVADAEGPAAAPRSDPRAHFVAAAGIGGGHRP